MNEKVMVIRGQTSKQSPEKRSSIGEPCQGCCFSKLGPACSGSEFTQAEYDAFDMDCVEAGVIYVKAE